MTVKESGVEIWAHGVGSSCKGNEYHHEIWHAVRNGIALCGAEVRGRDWFLRNGHTLKVETAPNKYQRFGAYDCQRCAKILNRDEE